MTRICTFASLLCCMLGFSPSASGQELTTSEEIVSAYLDDLSDQLPGSDDGTILNNPGDPSTTDPGVPVDGGIAALLLAGGLLGGSRCTNFRRARRIGRTSDLR